MNAATYAVTTGVIIAAGRWADDSDKTGVDVSLAINLTVYAVVLSVMEGVNAKFAGQFAMLIMVAAAFHAFARAKGIPWAVQGPSRDNPRFGREGAR